MASRERVEFDVVGRDSGGSKAFKDVGDAADKAADQIEGAGKASVVAGEEIGGLGKKTDRAGDQADDAGRQYRGLAADIAAATAAAAALAAEIDKTGNKDLVKDLDRQRREIRKLNRVQDLLPEIDTAAVAKEGERAGAVFSQGFRGFLSSGPGLVIGGALAATVVPTIASAVGGAVVGGIGIGGIVGGVVLAAQDSRVKAAGKQLGEAVMGDLNDSGARFVEPTLEGIGIIRAAWQDISGDVDSALAAAARYVEPLATGVADFVRELMPGIRDAAEAAGPIVREISEGLPRVGRALGDLFSGFADDADAGASAIRALFIVVEEGIGFVGSAVHFFSEMYRVLLDIGDAGGAVADILWGWNPIFSGPIEDGRKKIAELKGALDRGGDAGKDAGDKIAGGLQKVDDKATDSIAALQAWREELDRMTGTNLSARQAQRDLEAAIDDATAAVKENGKTAINHGAALDIDSAKGRANAAALDKIAKGANDAYDAVLEQTGSQELANQAAERGRAKFIELARKMGLSETAAAALADQLLNIKDRKVTVTANVQPAIDSAKSVVARINNMHARIKVSAEPSGGYGGSAHTGDGYSTGMSEGGRVGGDGPLGVDSQWRKLAPDEFVLRGAAARAIGYDTLDQLNQADRRPVQLSSAARSGGGGAGSDMGPLLTELRALRQLVAATPLVRLDSGRTADIYARGG